MQSTIYWHDYETFGVNPRWDRPAQFAGIRTDEDLNEIGDPLVLYCKPVPDVLPDPESCVITGITPQYTQQHGLHEPEFIAQIHAEFAVPGTCGAGYNTLRFDDEVTRHTLYRNFFDPYAREWKNGNSRWDIIDLSRMTYALRPEGITWPRRPDDDSKPSFKLEALTAANALGHESAHDALSDVRATIAWARLLKENQPRLYDWLYKLRDKRQAAPQLDLVTRAPALHTSGMYPPDVGCTTLVMPLAIEGTNKNSVLVFDLRHDPEPFMPLDVDGLHERLFTKRDELPEGMERLPVKSIKVNKCPALAPLGTLDEATAERISINVDECNRNREKILADEGFIKRVTKAYTRRDFGEKPDVDMALYDGFLDNADRSTCDRVRSASPEELAATNFNFRDDRLPELLFRYRARNWPESLSAEEVQRWAEFCHQRLEEGGGAARSLSTYLERIAGLREELAGDERISRVLDELDAWGKQLA